MSDSGDGGLATSATIGEISGIAVDTSGDLYLADTSDINIRKMTPASQTILITSVVDGASELPGPVSPGKIVVIYGGGFGSTVAVNGVAAPVFYESSTQVNAVVPYEVSGPAANITVASGGGISPAVSVPLAASAPSLFTYNGTGAGEAAAINVVDGTTNSATNPVKIGGYIELFATGEGQTTPAGVDGKLGGLPPAVPNLPVSVTIGGLPVNVTYKGGVYGELAGVMQVNVQIPAGVTPGGYVPVVLTVGNASTANGAVWIAVSN